MCAINAATSIFTPAFGSNFGTDQAQPIDFQDSYTSYCFALLFHKPQYLDKQIFYLPLAAKIYHES
jgi:hypothetical protein